MSATDELRRLLDERDVEWRDDSSIYGTRRTVWMADGVTYVAAEVSGRLKVSGYLTPEQAVDATLGRGTCSMGIERTFERIDGDEEHLLECSECGSRRWWLAHMMPSYCPNCGRKVIG